MSSYPLDPSISASPYEGQEQTDESRLIAEICERLIEWSELKKRRVVRDWINALASIAQDPESNEAVWLYLRLSTGDLGQVTASYSELGRQRNKSKQGQQQETERAMMVIARHKPELAKYITELLRHNRERSE